MNVTASPTATKPVIALCGPPGCGKSTLAQALMAKLSGGCLIDIDAYQSFTDQSVQQLEQWIANGGDYNIFDLNKLAADLQTLKRGDSITHPHTSTVIQAHRFILFETHFGRGHQQTGQHIDYLIWLDIPLDIALARNLANFCQTFSQPLTPAVTASLAQPFMQPVVQPVVPQQTATEGLGWLSNYLQAYSRTIRQTLTLQRQHIRPAADIWLDANQPIEQLAETLATDIGKKMIRL